MERRGAKGQKGILERIDSDAKRSCEENECTGDAPHGLTTVDCLSFVA